jgi:hypothetical protein
MILKMRILFPQIKILKVPEMLVFIGIKAIRL